ncbi:uncharacterized protein METZ01_LOCUS187964 [marine metagenome]|uniref:Uncharacterized protein n=1 Tax=marine metagenome TaxID=408172 RepID=A0A382D9K4_9ZZZZ
MHPLIPLESIYIAIKRKSTFQKFALECEWEIYQRGTPAFGRGVGYKTVENLILGFSYLFLDLGSTMVADFTRPETVY